MTNKLYACPVCGFETFDESPGSYNICDVCGWEDDGVQLANPACGGGANSESLIEAQEKILKGYPTTIKETNIIHKKYKRNQKWRPLTEAEKEKYRQQRASSYWMNIAVISEEEAYWNT